MAKEQNWDKINADKRKEINLGQAFNIVCNIHGKDLFSIDSEQLLKEINTVYQLLQDAHARIIDRIPAEVLEVNKGGDKLTLLPMK